MYNAIVSLPTQIYNKLASSFDGIKNAVLDLPNNLWEAFKGVMSYLFVPDEVTGYEFMISTFQSKIPAFFSIIDSVKALSDTEGQDEYEFNMTLPVVNVEIPIINFSAVSGFLTATKLIITALLYLWLGQYVLKQFDVKFSIG